MEGKKLGFLEIDGIQGHARDANHQGQIPIDSMRFSVYQGTDTSQAGVAEPGKAHFTQLEFTTGHGPHLPELCKAASANKRIDRAVVYIGDTSEDTRTTIKFTIDEVRVSSVSFDGGEHRLNVNFCLNYAKVQWEYQQLMPNGDLGSPSVAGYDIAGNAPL